MKAKIYVYLTLFLAAFVVISCGDDDTSHPEAVATFTASKTTVKVGEEIQFTNTSENATAFKWSFGDGTTSKEVSPKKAYTAGGTFLVSLLSTGSGGSEISNMEITVIPDPEIYFTDYEINKIQKFSTGNPAEIFDFLDVAGMGGVGIAYDPEHEKIYFSDFDTYGEGKIWRINLDGTDLEAIVEGLYDPYQIALDLDAGKVYWAEDADEDGIAHVGRVNLDGSDRENVVTLDGGSFTGVALDLDNDKLYYYDYNNEELVKANLDGSDPDPIISDVWGFALEVDEVNDKIYFDEQGSKLFMRANLDGSNVETIDDNGTKIYGIAIDDDNGKIYWSGRDSGVITRANLDGTHKEPLVSSLASVRGIFLKK